jgi:hypothetical protein
VDVAFVGLEPGDVTVAKHDPAARCLFKSAKEPENRRFPAARWAKKRKKFARLDSKIQRLKHEASE